jgi:predicted nucleic acid-binding protein
MKIYLDNCSFNRPFDDQTSMRIKLETDAKLHIQEQVKLNVLQLTWSYMLEYENSMNPYTNKRERIASWKRLAVQTARETPEIIATATTFQAHGAHKKDAIHLACAVALHCDYFITTDRSLLNKRRYFRPLQVMNPVEFVTDVLEGMP